MGQHPGMGRRDQAGIAAGVVAVLVSVQDLGDGPALRTRRGLAQAPLQRIDRQRLAGLRAGDEIVEIAVIVGGPDAFDDHDLTGSEPGAGWWAGNDPRAARRTSTSGS